MLSLQNLLAMKLPAEHSANESDDGSLQKMIQIKTQTTIKKPKVEYQTTLDAFKSVVNNRRTTTVNVK